MNEGHSHQFWATVTVHQKMMVPMDDHHSGWSQATRHIRTSWSTRNPRWLSTDLSSDTLGPHWCHDNESMLQGLCLAFKASRPCLI